LEINRSDVEKLTDIETRFQTVKLASLRAQSVAAFNINVATVNIRLMFDESWGEELSAMCRTYWAPFLAATLPDMKSDIDIVLAPADGDFIHVENPAWNIEQPFQFKVEDRTGTWIFHRDFTCLVRGKEYRVWLPQPTLEFTDAIDNIIALCVRPLAEKREAFLFHSSVIEHEGKAVVLFGPSGIGKSTAAKFSREWGHRVMASDQVYLHVAEGRLWASASPTKNPDIPRCPLSWVTSPLEVKAIFALKRTGELEVKAVDRVEMTRRFFAEIFRDETDQDFGAALKFACDATMLREVKQGSLSYPIGFNFWPRLKELGYI
jgi:hypothetical protein